MVEAPDPRSAEGTAGCWENRQTERIRQDFVPVLFWFCPRKSIPIVLITDTLLARTNVTDGRILRDRMLSGFCVRLSARKRTFLIATSVSGKQFRLMLGHWPLMSVDEARTKAMEVLRKCRQGERPSRPATAKPPTLREAIAAYCKAKGIKAGSERRYESLFRTHFGAWLDRPVNDMSSSEFAGHCHVFAKSKGAALVELGRGVVRALIRYVNAVHGLTLPSPFSKLADSGLLPQRAKPRARVLQESGLPAWRVAVDKLERPQRDFLDLVLYTGLRRNEARALRRDQIDLGVGVLRVPETKNGKPHTLPITPLMRQILERRCLNLAPNEELFKQVAAEHIAAMAMRAGAPRFMLHDLRKMLATVGEKLNVGNAVLRRVLNHTAHKSDVLHRHYVELSVEDVRRGLQQIQAVLNDLCAGSSPTGE